MIKNLFIVLLVIFLIGCNPKECFESSGEIIEQEFNVEHFTKIKVGNEVSLILKQGNEQKVIIETGSNLIDNIKVTVTDNKLFVEDNNNCNFTRDYAITKILITAPDITEIRSDTSREIQSNGLLNYQNLTLISEDFNEDALTNGTFKLEINSQNLSIIANGNSIYKISGATTNLNVGFFAGSSRFEAESLLANNVTIIQKSTNDILVNPQDKIEGTIYSIGNVISFNEPEIINMEALYTGRLIFN